ncbi:hypothetical protein VTK26DRAFT_8757 [Humicola hyalothermophila]
MNGIRSAQRSGHSGDQACYPRCPHPPNIRRSCPSQGLDAIRQQGKLPPLAAMQARQKRAHSSTLLGRPIHQSGLLSNMIDSSRPESARGSPMPQAVWTRLINGNPVEVSQDLSGDPRFPGRGFRLSLACMPAIHSTAE